MGLTRDEIIQYATRYVAASDVGDFPMDGDLFCLFSRRTDSNGGPAREPQWQFEGYGICRGYRLDGGTKPAGKWVWFEYLSLATFPPHVTEIKLQPPHVVTGTFQTGDRGREMRVVRMPATPGPDATAGEGSALLSGAGAAGPEGPLPQNVLRFPGPRSRKPSRTGGT